MNAHRSRWLLVGAIGVVVLANVVALAGAAYNRGGTPESTLTLGERELGPTMQSADSEDSALALRLEYQVAGDEPGVKVDWLDAAKLAALGIHAPRPRAPEVRHSMTWVTATHEMLLVLELDGPAYRRAVEQACAPEVARQTMAAAAEPPRPATSEVEARLAESVAHRCTQARERDSRLYVIDVGRDRIALRARYPDRSHYAIVHGTITVSNSVEGGIEQVSAHVGRIEASTIHVPRSRRTAFEGASGGGRGGAAARFSAEIAFGRRLEPWLVDARAAN
jgi:hypothetical protein